MKGDPASPTTSINIIDTGATGWILKQQGWTPGSFALDASEDHKVPEVYSIAHKQTTHDNVATAVRTFVGLLRDAYRYHKAEQPEPVFIKQQTTGESNERYSMVYGSPELEFPGLFDLPFEANSDIEFFSLTIIREHPWGSLAPGQIGSALTLVESDGEADGDPDMVHVANFRDDGNITHVFVDDGGVFGSNIISAGSGTALFPAVPAAGDNLYFGSTDIAFKHICVGIAAAGNYTWDLDIEYWNGSGWTDLVRGTTYTVFAAAGGEVEWENVLFRQAGLWSINVFPPSNWAKTPINSVNAYWIRVHLNTVTGTTTVPTKDADTIYAQRTNSVEIPAASIKGDSPPLSLVRLWTPSGGGSTVGKANLSRILVGAKAEIGTIDLDDFEPMLNLGNVDNPAGWTTSYGDDTSSSADTEAPGGATGACTFATDATMDKRVTLLGDNKLEDYVGEYRLFVGCRQSGGAAGDITLKGRIFVGGTGDTDPHADTREKKTRATDKGVEVVDLGIVRFPLNEVFDADSLVNVDIGIEIHAERTTGSSTIDFDWIFLFPIREGSVGVDDPVTDTSVGSSALRGGSVMDIDAGLIADRNQVSIYDGTNLLPVGGEWGRFNRPIEFKNVGVRHKLYFMMLHYAVGNDWNTEPLIASIGCHLACEVFMSYGYALLRGSG
jgi:hypothetical protein